MDKAKQAVQGAGNLHGEAADDGDSTEERLLNVDAL
jgi:hypothetical protein